MKPRRLLRRVDLYFPLQRGRGVLPRIAAPIGNRCVVIARGVPSAGHQALIGQLDTGSVEKIPEFLKSFILRALPGVTGITSALARRRGPRDLIGQTDVRQNDKVVMMVNDPI